MTEQNLIVKQDFLAPAIGVKDALQAYQDKKEFIEGVLREGVDFGVVPGSTKPALLKPGAEKMSSFFGLRPSFSDITVIEDWTGEQHGGEQFFYYRQKCSLYRAGEIIGTADGSCNSWEKKYRYRQSDRMCPICGKTAIIKGKIEYGGGWICFGKKGGCGEKFTDQDERITKQETGQVKNLDIAEQVNTILKMAQKRALVASILIATGASDYFTQDIEDYVPGEFVEGKVTEIQDKTPANHDEKQDAAKSEPIKGPAQILQTLVARGLAENIPAASTIVNSLGLVGKKGDLVIRQVQIYRGWRDTGLTSPEAFAKTIAGEIPK